MPARGSSSRQAAMVLEGRELLVRLIPSLMAFFTRESSSRQAAMVLARRILLVRVIPLLMAFLKNSFVFFLYARRTHFLHVLKAVSWEKVTRFIHIFHVLKAVSWEEVIRFINI
jgi:hypothetical protein